MRVERIIVENFKALKGEVELTPGGHSFFLLGGNNKGKSSIGKVLYDLITNKFPSQVITEGEKEGFAQVELDNGMIVFAKFHDGKKPKVEVVTPEGAALNSKDLFKKWQGEGWEFDIDKFLSSQPKLQRTMLENIVGLDLTALIEDEKRLEDERKIANREVKEQKAKAVEYDQHLAQLEEISAQVLLNSLSELKNRQQSIQILSDRRNQILSDIESLENEIKLLGDRIADISSELRRIDPVDDFEIIDKESELENLEQKNKDIREARRIAAEHIKLEAAEKVAKELDDQVKQVREMRDDMIKAKPLPAEGLTFDFDGGGLLLHGLPFEDNQVSTSAKTIAALQIAEAMLGEIRYLHLSGESLDKENAMKVSEWAEQKGLQLAIERPLWEGGELKWEIIQE